MIQYRSKSSASARRVKCIVLDTEVLDSHRGRSQRMPRPTTTAMSPEPELAKMTDTRSGDPSFALHVLAPRQRSYSLRSSHDHLTRFLVVFRASREQTECDLRAWTFILWLILVGRLFAFVWSAARPNPNLRFASPKPIES